MLAPTDLLQPIKLVTSFFGHPVYIGRLIKFNNIFINTNSSTTKISFTVFCSLFSLLQEHTIIFFFSKIYMHLTVKPLFI